MHSWACVRCEIYSYKASYCNSMDLKHASQRSAVVSYWPSLPLPPSLCPPAPLTPSSSRSLSLRPLFLAHNNVSFPPGSEGCLQESQKQASLTAWPRLWRCPASPPRESVQPVNLLHRTRWHLGILDSLLVCEQLGDRCRANPCPRGLLAK